MKDLSSYVSETLHTQRKRQKPSRVFFEELAVIEPEKGFRILASRGEDLPVGADFFTTCGVLKEDAELLHSFSAKQTGFLLPCKRGCALLFGDLRAETGLFLSVLLSRDAKDVLCALKRMGYDQFAAPQGILPTGELLTSRYDEALVDQLEELFYYLDRILHPAPEASLWTRCLLIANFVGCRLERVALPVTAPSLSERDDARMMLFLLCAFLDLRKRSGRVLTEGLQESSNYQCTVSFFEESRPLLEDEEKPQESLQAPELPLFLEALCFSALTAIPTGEGMRLETRFPVINKEQTLGAVVSPAWICLCFGITRVGSSRA